MFEVQDPPVPDYVHGFQRIDTFNELKEILTSQDFVMSGTPERTIFLEDTLIMSDGQRHSQLKQLAAPLFSRQALAYYELHLLEPVIREVIAEQKSTTGRDGRVRLEACALIKAALTRISARVTGVDGVDTPERTDRFRELVMELGEATTGTFSRIPHEKVVQMGKDALARLVDEFLQASLDRRVELTRCVEAGEIARKDLPRDLLMSLALNHDIARPDDDVKIPYVWRHCALFLTGSIKTTSHTLPHAIFHLDEWVREHPADRAKLTDPEFLHRATAETFRLHQTSPVRFRQAVRDVTLSTGRKVAKDEIVAMHTPPANIDSAIWGEDTRFFDPYRAVPAGLRPWGLAFGAGAHACSGQNLVTGIMNKGDDKAGTHGTAVRVLKALYDLGAELDPDDPPRRATDTMHDRFATMPLMLRNA